MRSFLASAGLQGPGDRRVAAVGPLIVCLTPLALGGATAAAERLVVAIVLLVAVASVATSHDRAIPPSSRVVVYAHAAVVLLVAVQLVPLPCSFVDALSSDGRGRFALGIARELGPARAVRCRISLDPGAGTRALAVAGAILASVIVGAFSARTRKSARAVVAAVSVGATAVCVVTLAHAAAGAAAVYGVYHPVYADYGLIGPLLNGNHLALVGSLGFLASFHLVLTGRRPSFRIAAGIAGSIDAVVTIATHSRGGVVSLGLAIVAVASIAMGASAKGRSLGRPTLLLGVAGMLVCAGLGFALEWDALIADFEHSPYKTGLIATSLRAALSAGVLGFGRGGFSAGFAAESDEIARAMVPENLVAQWTTELGLVPGATLLALVIVPALRGVVSRQRSSSAAACAIALVAFAHDLGDFAVELPGAGCMVGLALGAGVVRESRDRRAPIVTRPRSGLVVLGLATLAVSAGVVASYGRDLQTVYRAAFRERAAGHLAASDEILERALVDHPFEPSLYVQLAANAAGRPGDRAIRWANLARRRAPLWPSSNLVLAEHFFRRGRDAQAVAELASVSRISSREVARAICAHEDRRIDPVRLARVVPLDTNVIEMANVLRACLSGDRFRALVEAAIDSGRDHPSLEVLAIEAAATDGGSAAADVRYLAAAARHPRDPSIALAGSRNAASLRNGDAARERAELARRSGASIADAEAALARAASIAGDAAGRDRALAALRREAEEGRIPPEIVPTVEAECAAIEGRPDAEIAADLRAFELARNPDRLLRIEAVARTNGRLERAADAIALLCREFPDHARCVTRGDAE